MPCQESDLSLSTSSTALKHETQLHQHDDFLHCESIAHSQKDQKADATTSPGTGPPPSFHLVHSVRRSRRAICH